MKYNSDIKGDINYTHNYTFFSHSNKFVSPIETNIVYSQCMYVLLLLLMLYGNNFCHIIQIHIMADRFSKKLCEKSIGVPNYCNLGICNKEPFLKLVVLMATTFSKKALASDALLGPQGSKYGLQLIPKACHHIAF